MVVGDLYFVNPRPEPGQEGPEQGVRLEVRLLERGTPPGSIYSARPIVVDRPIWRVDLLESVDRPGTLDRAHHHPRFGGWEPGGRHFDDRLSADPLAWLEGRLADLPGLLGEAGVADGRHDAEAVRAAAPEIMAAVRRLLDGVRSGRLGRAPEGSIPESARLGWL